MENGHRNSVFFFLKNVIFHSYASLPEGNGVMVVMDNIAMENGHL